MSNEDTSGERSHERNDGSEQSYQDRRYLYEQYVERRKSAGDIADDCDVSSSTIRRWLDRHDIERSPRYKDESWLRKQYVEHRLDQQTIAEKCDVAKTTICHWLARHGITDGESFETAECATCGDKFRYYSSVRNGQYCSNECANDPRKRQVEVTCPNCDRTFQRRRSLDTEYCSMDCWGADNRSRSDSNGYCRYYSGEWREKREEALERDDYRCTVCGISDQHHRRRFGRGLEVHHVVPVRLFDQWDRPIEDAHSCRNLVTVCRTHHPDAPGTTVRPWRDEPPEQRQSLTEVAIETVQEV